MGALFLRGTLLAMNGQREAAIKSFNEVLRLNPRAAAAQVQLAQLNLERGEADAAVGIASEAVSNAPNVPEARLVLARALIAQNDLTRAESEIDRLLAVYPRAPSVQSLRGTLFLLKGNPSGARAAFQLAFDSEPGSIAALTGLTMLDVQEKRLDQARARVEQRLKVDDSSPALLLVAAKVYVQSGDLASAERVLRKAIERAPTTIEPYVLLGEIYREQKRMDIARAELDAVVKVNPANVAARTMAAMLVHAQQDPAEAKRRYQELLNIEPQAAVAANNLAWIYAEEQQNLDEALQLAQRAVELMSDFPEAWDTLGWVYIRKQLPILAVEPFERAVGKAPDNATFRYHLGLALAGSGDRVKGRDSFEMALKLQPNFPDARRRADGARPVGLPMRVVLWLLGIELLVLYAPTLMWLWDRWTMSVWHNAHGLLIPPVVAYFVYQELKQRPRPAGRAPARGALLFLRAGAGRCRRSTPACTRSCCRPHRIVVRAARAVAAAPRRASARARSPSRWRSSAFALPIPLGADRNHPPGAAPRRDRRHGCGRAAARHPRVRRGHHPAHGARALCRWPTPAAASRRSTPRWPWRS